MNEGQREATEEWQRERIEETRELFLAHQSWYLRAQANLHVLAGTMLKARRKESPEFTERASETPFAKLALSIASTILRIIISNK